MTAERYEVQVRPLVGVVKVEAVLFGRWPDGPVAYVWPPSWWERWRGVTWEQKVERAKARVERWARRWLAASLAAAAVTRGERGGGGRCQPPTKS